MIELFQAHEGLLVAELNREVFYECGDEGGAEDEEMSPEFSAFLATLDSQVAGPESRPINVGAICAETRDECTG